MLSSPAFRLCDTGLFDGLGKHITLNSLMVATKVSFDIKMIGKKSIRRDSALRVGQAGKRHEIAVFIDGLSEAERKKPCCLRIYGL